MDVEQELYDYLPMLGRGRHWSPRKGACFMELASYLAGERWSDAPACTHPLLAHLARRVNDEISDAARPSLALLVPSVIGLTSDDPHWDLEVTLLAASHAMPIVAESAQRALAVGMLATERLLDELDERPAGTLTPRTRFALGDVPLAGPWARCFMDRVGRHGSRNPGPQVVDLATRSIAAACVQDADDRLRSLLSEAVTLCRGLARRGDEEVEALDMARWSSVCRPVPVARVGNAS